MMIFFSFSFLNVYFFSIFEIKSLLNYKLILFDTLRSNFSTSFSSILKHKGKLHKIFLKVVIYQKIIVRDMKFTSNLYINFNTKLMCYKDQKNASKKI